MSKRYTYALELSWGGDTPTAEMEVEVSYTVTWGAPEQGPSYASGGQPADPDEIDDIRLEKVEGKPRPWGMGYGFISDDDFADECVQMIEGSERLMADLLTNAAEEAAADYDDAMDYHAEQQRDAAAPLPRLGR
jgi:hypothetical protein